MKRILITGGSGGIGEACVEKFTSKGHEVVFLYHKNISTAQSLSSRTGAHALQADLADPDEARRAAAEAIALLGGVEALIHCAGIAQIKLFTDLDDGDWSRMLNTNLTAVYTVTRAVVPHMIAAHYGRIVNIGSMWGKTGASCEVPYSAAKAGIEGFTKALAKELGPSNITVNCVEPGVIATPMNRELDPETLRALCDQTPLCRLGTPAEVAEAVYFLASDHASFITGQILGVDGGFAV